MALQPRRIFVDVQNRAFVSSPTSTLPSTAPVWIKEDVEAVEIYALRPVNNSFAPFEYVDLTGATVKFGIGAVSPAALQTAWTSLSTAVTISNTEVQEGGTFGGTVDEEQKLTWSGAAPVQGTYALSFPYRDISFNTTIGSTIYQASNHGLYDGMTVSISGQDYTVINSGQNSFALANRGSTTAITAGATSSGTLSVPTITTPPIAYNATTAQVQASVVAAGFVLNGIPQVQVSGTNGIELNFRFTGRSGRRSYSPIIVSNSSLKAAPGVTANVSYNTQEIAALIAAGTTNVTMEVEISEGAVRQTFRQGATLSADLITSTSPSPLPAVTATSFALQSANGTVFTISVTNSGELTIAS
jgi:hypothetical protein